MRHLVFVISLLFSAPLFIDAQSAFYTVNFFNRLTILFGIIIPYTVSLGLLLFIWGLAKFIAHSGNEKSVAQGKHFMIWGIIVLFVMVSVWGIIGLMQTMTGANPATAAPTPPVTNYTP